MNFDNRRRRQFIPLLLAVVLIASMVARGGLQRIRTVDALALFAAGVGVGSSIASFRRS